MEDCCKVGTLISTYDLRDVVADTDVEDYLLSRWIGRGDYATTGLRPLTDWFNQRLMKSVYNDHERKTLDTRIQSDYEALRRGETDRALLEDLRADGIDGEQLQSDFVSTTTLYRHFTGCLDMSKSTDPSQANSNWEEEKVDYAKDILRTNVEESLRSLENKGQLRQGSKAEIKTDIVLGCPDCPTQISFERALQRGYICQEHMYAAEGERNDDNTNEN